jgi:hypothetical protein
MGAGVRDMMEAQGLTIVAAEGYRAPGVVVVYVVGCVGCVRVSVWGVWWYVECGDPFVGCAVRGVGCGSWGCGGAWRVAQVSLF